MNAEFLRNVWLELTPSRLLVAPLVLAAILLVVWYSADRASAEVATAARLIYFMLVLFWGTRRAANALSDEINGGTWDAQRMTALSPWAMTWGKFFGGTAYVWYTSLIALAVAVVMDPAPLDLADRLSTAIGPICTGLAAMLTSFFVVLLHLRRPRGPGRRTSFLAQATGIAVGLVGWYFGAQMATWLPESAGSEFYMYGTSNWYGIPCRSTTILIATQVALAFWLGFGVYRAVCAELQKPTWPWGWPLVSGFLIAYLLGFILPLEVDQPVALALLPATLAALALFYLALLGDGKDGIKLRWFVRALAHGDAGRAARLFPAWLFSLVLAAGLAIALAIVAPTDRTGIVTDLYRELSDGAVWREPSYLAWAGAIVLFMLRDTALVLYLGMSVKARSPDIAATVLLGTSYVVLPLLLGFVAPSWTLAIAVPWPFAHPAIALAGPLATLIPIAWLLARRWRALAPHPA